MTFVPTYKSCRNEADEVPFFCCIQVVGHHDDDHVSDDLCSEEEEDAKLATEHVAPSSEIESEKYRKNVRHHCHVNIELGNLGKI